MKTAILPLQFRGIVFSVMLVLLSVNFSFGQNPIVAENLLTGTPQSEWYVNEGGPIEGFAQEFSVNKGEIVHFKINIASSTLVPYTVRIYRIGWYQGNGARFIADLGSSLTGKSQPAYNYETATGKADCTNWSVSTQWTVPNNSSIVSGVYIARFDCPAVGGTSIQAFVIKDDAANSPVLFKTSDATWQAYNSYGGNTFYTAATPVPGFTHATKVSYQRPVYIRGDKTSFFNSEYPMIRFLEKNGYNLSYTTDLDMARNSIPITTANHKLILSVGHDEYWSAEQRNSYEAARANGVNIAFFSGNEMYWKTRWEDNFQTLVCYKEGTQGENTCGYKCDPLPNVWTGVWRGGCSPTYAPNDGCKPEGTFSGQMSWSQSFGSIQVPDTYKNFRMWKNTSIASLAVGQTVTFPFGTLGSEWDPEQLTENYPAHRIALSKTIQTGLVHKISLYKHSSGALVFSAGTMNWAWGLDDNHENGNLPASADMQQGTINLLHDMGLDPVTIQSNLVMPTIGPDVLAPSTTISSPSNNAIMPGSTVTIIGTSTDNGNSTVAGVEVSIDNGTTWHNATGLENWTYTFSPTGYGTRTIKVRAWDDLGNVETAGAPGSANAINISFSGPFIYSVFNSSYPAAAPSLYTGNPVELGMKFRSSIAGNITGFRYYKAAGVNGEHIGHLWNSTGTLLASKTFVSDSTTGWKSVSLDVPVAINANTTYIVSYFSASGDFTKLDPFFTQAVVNGIMRGLANGEDGGNGVYAYNSSSIYPDNTSGSSNYFVDVLFNPADASAPVVSTVTPPNNNTGVVVNIHPTAIFNKSIDPSTVSTATVIMTGSGNTVIPSTVSLTDGSKITVTPNADLTAASTYTITLKGGIADPTIKDLLGNSLAEDYSWKFTTAQLSGPVVTLQPVAQNACANNSITFTSAATGTPTPTAQWQFSTDNGATWANIAGATSNSYTFIAVPANNNTQYRAVWINSVSAVRSTGAVLTVSAAVTGSIAAVNPGICPGGLMQLQLTSATGPSPYSLTINSNTYTGISVGQIFTPVGTNETIFAASDVPSEQTVSDNNSVEVGVKFSSNKNGAIKGIRFYKGSAANSGTHIGSLWNQSGTLLASATFTNESASGWQEILFAAPVSINANTTYVASYFLPHGNYSRTGSYFVNSHSNGNSLTALQKTTAEPNAVYMYTSQSAFPGNNFGEPNYWVDVIFAANINSTTTFNLTNIAASNGCSTTGNPISSATITVGGPVNAGTISGSSPLCSGSTTSYSSNGNGNGVWSSSNPSVATVNAAGLVTALSPGTTNIVYSIIVGCNSPASSFKTLTVSPNANAGTISGASPLCLLLGSTTYSSNGNTGGTWSSSNPLVATVNSSGRVSALIVGTTNISYTVSTGCNSPVTATKILSVNIIANAGSINGSTPICAGTNTNYSSNGDAGGTWKSSNTAVATVNTSGVVTGVSAGTATITYTVNGCIGTAVSSKTITIKPVNTCGLNVRPDITQQNYFVNADLTVESHSSANLVVGKNENNKMKIEAYPNPATSEFTLALKGYNNSKVRIIVTDVMGKKVYQTDAVNIQQYHFGKDFIPGIYLLEVVSGNNRQSMKLIKE